MKVLVSGYQSIDMHCIVLLVKFDDELSISFLRKKQLFTKEKGGQKYTFSKKVPIFKSISNPENITFFWHRIFLLNGIDNLLLNLTWT
jgi:hypothetical protein